MSDFFNGGWSVYIAAVTLLGLAACLGLLIIAARRKVMAGDNTTGHVWDEDLRELNNPLPMWWMGLFVVTVVFSLAYLVFYPGLGSAEGTLKWSSLGQHEAEQKAAAQASAPLYARIAGQSAEALAHDPQAMGIGERLFVNNCAACHGSDARGSKGFPDLTDGDWLHGGTPEKIEETIAKGRTGTMPPMIAAVGGAQDMHNLAQYVLSLSGSPHDSVAAYSGKAKFAACAACHGMDGKGNQALGAPNLTDKVWLHGWGEAAITAMVSNGKTNVMPQHASRLSPEQIHVLTAYVWNLSKSKSAALAAAQTRQ
jgi:cytochrome c oxidase cbb3-type subunit 3